MIITHAKHRKAITVLSYFLRSAIKVLLLHEGWFSNQKRETTSHQNIYPH